MLLSDFDFDLPASLIARVPIADRAASRLLRVLREGYEHLSFRDIVGLLHPSDVLVLNDTAVLKARLLGQKPTGGRVELLIEKIKDHHHALVHIKSNKRLSIDQRILLLDPVTHAVAPGYELEIVERIGNLFLIRRVLDACADPDPDDSGWRWLAVLGILPLPPYLKRQAEAVDEQRYQTVYHRVPGAVAAPTAGLHFDEGLLSRIQQQGIQIERLILHVGAGTFKPVTVHEIENHSMHSEYCEIDAETALRINQAKAQGRRIIAVGTTTLRCLESAGVGGSCKPYAGETSIFLYPGAVFNIVDILITNFHVPRSTLLMLVSAFVGRERILQAYQEAIDLGYRFYSYGDAMWLDRSLF
jgi:S-adenosylmethionine:tRNA ribosyltransferase-isomerase